MEIGFYYDFGELKAGDRFAYKGGEYEKISGNFADVLCGDKVVDTEEIPEGAKVYLYEVG